MILQFPCVIINARKYSKGGGYHEYDDLSDSARGKRQGNAEVRYIGWTDIPLDAKGVVQAQELCYKLQQCAIDEIYASPLQRAIATAAPIAEVLRKQIHIENG